MCFSQPVLGKCRTRLVVFRLPTKWVSYWCMLLWIMGLVVRTVAMLTQASANWVRVASSSISCILFSSFLIAKQMITVSLSTRH